MPKWAVMLVPFLLLARPTRALLIPCPDCEAQVSSRAIMCPACGCPGDAIREAAVALEEADRPPPVYPVLHASTSTGEGYALAVETAAGTHLVLDARFVGTSARLHLGTLVDNQPVFYQRLQVALTQPLLRFATDTTNAIFLTTGTLPEAGGDDDLYWLLTDGVTTTIASRKDAAVPPNALALVDAVTNLLAIVCRSTPNPLLVPWPEESAWLDHSPSAFRLTMQEALQQPANPDHEPAFPWLREAPPTGPEPHAPGDPTP